MSDDRIHLPEYTNVQIAYMRSVTSLSYSGALYIRIFRVTLSDTQDIWCQTSFRLVLTRDILSPELYT